MYMHFGWFNTPNINVLAMIALIIYVGKSMLIGFD